MGEHKASGCDSFSPPPPRCNDGTRQPSRQRAQQRCTAHASVVQHGAAACALMHPPVARRSVFSSAVMLTSTPRRCSSALLQARGAAGGRAGRKSAVRQAEETGEQPRAEHSELNLLPAQQTAASCAVPNHQPDAVA